MPSPSNVHYYVTNEKGQVVAVYYGGRREVIQTSRTAAELNQALRS